MYIILIEYISLGVAVRFFDNRKVTDFASSDVISQVVKQGGEQGGDWEAVDERKSGISEDEHKNRNVVYYKVCETEQNRKGPTVTFCITDMFPQKEIFLPL